MRTRMTIAAVVACAALVGIVVLIVRGTNDNENAHAGTFRLPPTVAAAAPFGAFGTARLAVDGHCAQVLVAQTASQRTQGLRHVDALGPYAGMLFVNERDTSARYTMADTRIPLDIVFLDADGQPVDHTSMQPCPDGTDATCPTYASRRQYRFALERPAGSTGAGAIGTCAA